MIGANYKRRLLLSYFVLFALSVGLMLLFLFLARKQIPDIPRSVYRLYLPAVAILLAATPTCLLLAYYKYTEFITKLKYLISYFSRHSDFPTDISFKDNDLYQIQCLMQDIYLKMREREREISKTRSKLIEHFHYMEEGISVFTPDFQSLYTNSQFIQHLNILLNTVTFNVQGLFQSKVFAEVVRFLRQPKGMNNFRIERRANNHSFLIQVIIFDDQCFEIIIRDTTHVVRDDLRQSEIANTIAHELFTPITSIRGYLETLIAHQELSPEKRQFYLQRTYKQVIRLSEIIQDTVLLSRASTAKYSFTMEPINLYELLLYLTREQDRDLIAINRVTVQIQVDKNTSILGNRTLLKSVFTNLGHNSIKYAGTNCMITVHQYLEDDHFYYFSFSDNGPGVDEKVLDRLFDRFFRVGEGRTRAQGGSGLGLSIVKEAILFHHGQISARNRAGGGMEFLFTLRKY
jgi:signal transduction histidine kinase